MSKRELLTCLRSAFVDSRCSASPEANMITVNGKLGYFFFDFKKYVFICFTSISVFKLKDLRKSLTSTREV